MKRYEPRQKGMFIDGQPEMHEASDGDYIRFDDPAIAAAVTAMENTISVRRENFDTMNEYLSALNEAHASLRLALANLTKGTA